MKNFSKKIVIALVIAMMMLLTIGVTACNFQYTLYFKVDGEVYDTIKTNGSSKVEIPENPVKEGYTFEGWFWDEGSWTKPFTANSLLDAPITSNMSVYAKFSSGGCTVEEGYSYDSLYHWNNCSLGDQHNKREHTFVNGVCSVCRYRDDSVNNTTINENWQPAKKNTVYSYEWLVDNNKQLKYDRLTKKQVGYDYYYMYYLGYIDNVILESENYKSFYLDEKIKSKSTYETGTVTSNEISKSISSTLSSSITVGATAELGVEGAKISTSLEVSTAATKSTEDTLTTMAQTASEASLESDFYNAPKGYYRLVSCCSIDVFEYAVYNVLTNEFTTYNVAIADKNINVMWDYSKDSSRFDDVVVTDTIEFAFDQDYLLGEKERICSEFYIPVSKAAELFAIRNNPNGNYLLTKDIDLCGMEWTPIETFSGVLNGNGHKICNLTINNTNNKGTRDYGFIKLHKGIISNMIFTNIKCNVKNTTSGKTQINIGGIVSDNYGVIQNCKLEGESVINCILDDQNDNENALLRVGGIVAHNHKEIIGCSIENTMIYGHISPTGGRNGEDTDAVVGGITAVNYGVIEDCVTTNVQMTCISTGNGWTDGWDWFGNWPDWANLTAVLGGVSGILSDTGTVRNCITNNNQLVCSTFNGGDEWYIHSYIHVGSLIGQNFATNTNNIQNCISSYETVTKQYNPNGGRNGDCKTEQVYALIDCSNKSENGKYEYQS